MLRLKILIQTYQLLQLWLGLNPDAKVPRPYSDNNSSSRAMRTQEVLALLGALPLLAVAQNLDACPGYKATNVHTSSSTLTADLELAGKACNVYGSDIQKLSLSVVYETGKRKLVVLFY